MIVLVSDDGMIVHVIDGTLDRYALPCTHFYSFPSNLLPRFNENSKVNPFHYIF